MTITMEPRYTFKVLPKDRMREIASMGGKAAHRAGRAHQFNSEEAKRAAAKSVAVRKAKRTQQPQA